ncbi:hypothetical protein [Tenacibaculum dicentrarchi]|uniref:hypothetical protein n=1 Tax=Tenacibaculum dicentrarchi TaxID=669041 RepID=UPI001BE8ED90
MVLLKEEEIITESADNQIILTNKRVRYYYNSKKTDYTSILLNRISSIEVVKTQKNILYLYIGIFMILADIRFMIGLLALLGIVLIGLFVTSSKHVVSITPNGGKPIIFSTKGFKNEFINDFVNKVEKASSLT